MGILSSIKQKPDNQKKIISLVIALILTFFIVGLWFSFTSDSGGNQSAEGSQDKLSSISPWQVIKDDFSKAFSGFNGSTSSPQESLSSSTVPVEVIEATGTATTTN